MCLVCIELYGCTTFVDNPNGSIKVYCREPIDVHSTYAGTSRNGQPHADPNNPELKPCELVLAIDLLGVLDGRCPKGPFDVTYTTVLDPEHRLCWRHENEREVERDAQEEHQKWLD